MAFEQKLIKLVRDRKCLYHTKSRSNKNNLLRVAVWKSISEELGRSVAECKQRWRSLRDRFVRERKKMEQTGNSSADVDRWELYDMLEFLTSSVQTRRQRAVTSPIVPDTFSFDESFQSTPSASKSPGALLDMKEVFVIPDFSYDETAQTATSTSNRTEASPHDSKEVFVDLSVPETNENHMGFETVQTVPSASKRSAAMLMDPNEAFLDLIGGLKAAVDSRLLPEKDENDLFLECMGKKMKRLSEAAKLRIQAKLLANVTEELLKE